MSYLDELPNSLLTTLLNVARTSAKPLTTDDLYGWIKFFCEKPEYLYRILPLKKREKTSAVTSISFDSPPLDLFDQVIPPGRNAC